LEINTKKSFRTNLVKRQIRTDLAHAGLNSTHERNSGRTDPSTKLLRLGTYLKSTSRWQTTKSIRSLINSNPVIPEVTSTSNHTLWDEKKIKKNSPAPRKLTYSKDLGVFPSNLTNLGSAPGNKLQEQQTI